MKNHNFLVRFRYAIKTAYFFCLAYLNQSVANFLDWRMEAKRRRWTAIGTFGSGLVPLGKVNMNRAMDKTAKFGTIVKIDVEGAIIFYSSKGSF